MVTYPFRDRAESCLSKTKRPTRRALIRIYISSPNSRFNVDPGEDFQWEAEPDQRTINNMLPDEYQRSAMLALYLDLERVECLTTSQPSEELRRSLDALSTKSSKQMNSVAKQFGSIGRSMSSKIKKNFGSMAKLTGKGSQSNPEEGIMRRQSTCEVLCCRVLAARAPVQEEMVKNYLNEAWIGSVLLSLCDRQVSYNSYNFI